MSNIKDQVRRYIDDNFVMGTSAAALTDTDSFLEHQVLDSTGFLELISFLEETFGIRVKDDEMIPENLDCLEAIDGFVRRKCGP